MDRKSLVRNLVKEKPYLSWYTKADDLSYESVLESVLNYGSWEDYIHLEKILGIEEVRALFEKITSKKRVNLRPQTVEYYRKYFQKYT